MAAASSFPTSIPTFPCPCCGALLPATMPAGTRFPCTSFRQSVVCPQGVGYTAAQTQQNLAWAVMHVNTAAAMSDARAPGRSRGPFASTSRQTAFVDARGRLRILGSQVDARGTWEMRAIDPATGQVVWTTMQGSHFQVCPSPSEIAEREGIVYVAHQGRLCSIDGESGRVRWEISIPASLRRGATETDELAIVHLHPGGQRGVVAFKSEDGGLTAVDRDLGHILWRCQVDTHASIAVVPNVGVLVAEHGRSRLLRAHDGAAMAEVPGRAIHVNGRLLVNLSSYGPEDQEQDGVGVYDLAAGRFTHFHPADHVDVSPGVASFGPRHVLLGADGKLLVVDESAPPPKKGIFARYFSIGSGDGGARPLPFPGFLVSQIRAAGPYVAVDLHGANHEARRVVLLDAQTLAVRYDSGPLLDTDMPDGDLLIVGDVLVFTVTNQSQVELRAVAVATGQALWAQGFGDIRDVFVLGSDRVALYEAGSITVVRVGDGARVGFSGGSR